MVTTRNWIKDTLEFVRNAMNKGLRIGGFYNDVVCEFYADEKISIGLNFGEKNFTLNTPKGFLEIPYTYSERDKLELKSMCLAISEYNEDMAISEFDHYFKSENEPKTVNDLDDDDE